MPRKFEDENFRKVCDYDAGELLVKPPLVFIKGTYSGGEGYVNEDNTIGYFAIDLTGISFEPDFNTAEFFYQDEDYEMERYRNYFSENPVDSEYKEELDEMFRHLEEMVKDAKLYVFVSRDTTGTKYFSAPVMATGQAIDGRMDGRDFVLIDQKFNLEGKLLTLEEAYNQHTLAVFDKELECFFGGDSMEGEFNLDSDENAITELVTNLPKELENVYDQLSEAYERFFLGIVKDSLERMK